MKRLEALKHLSHQHHNSLMACLLVRKGIAKKADGTVLNDFLRRFFREDIEPHFEAEEQHLFPVVQKLKPAYFNILVSDHQMLRTLSDRFVNSTATADYLAKYADLLEQHIRFEERVVFNYVQTHLDSAELNTLEHSLSNLHAKKCTDYPTKFWE